jgi:hypothetical protein
MHSTPSALLSRSGSNAKHTILEQVEIFGKKSKSKSSQKAGDKENSVAASVYTLSKKLGDLTDQICAIGMPTLNPPSPLRRQKSKFRRKSKLSSARSPPPSHSSPSWTEIAPSMSLSTLMPTQMFPWNGATVMPRRLRTPRKCN